MGGTPAKVAAAATCACAGSVRATHAVAAPPSGGQGGACPGPGAVTRTTATKRRAPASTGATSGLAVGRVARVRVAGRPLRLLRVERAPRPTAQLPLCRRVGVGVPAVASKAPSGAPKRGVVAPPAAPARVVVAGTTATTVALVAVGPATQTTVVVTEVAGASPIPLPRACGSSTPIGDDVPIDATVVAPPQARVPVRVRLDTPLPLAMTALGGREVP